ncbi:MAG: hypothetical protein LBI31_01660 [Zoogloeaceae bacterium]|jgi:hypothetical protein|nr:hypothetical protein [Zoogloeaceae bacterium]
MPEMPVDFLINEPESFSVEVWQKYLARLRELPDEDDCKVRSIRFAERRIEMLEEYTR